MQRNLKTESWVHLPLSVPKIPKIIEEKIPNGAGKCFLNSYGALRTFMQNNPIFWEPRGEYR